MENKYIRCFKQARVSPSQAARHVQIARIGVLVDDDESAAGITCARESAPLRENFGQTDLDSHNPKSAVTVLTVTGDERLPRRLVHRFELPATTDRKPADTHARRLSRVSQEQDQMPPYWTTALSSLCQYQERMYHT